jgi:hypothetical protein
MIEEFDMGKCVILVQIRSLWLVLMQRLKRQYPRTPLQAVSPRPGHKLWSQLLILVLYFF